MAMSVRPTLQQITQQADFLPDLAVIAERVTQASDSSEVTALLAEAACLAGADVAAFASFMQDDEFYESYRVILACDPLWCLAYENDACYMHDPWLTYARHHSEPVLAHRLPARTNKEIDVRALASEFGFVSALIVPSQAPHGLTRLGALCIGSREPDYFDDPSLWKLTFGATALAMRLHEWEVAQLRSELLQTASLTPDDLTLLRHQLAGHKSKEVARAINTTAMAVDSHWQRLNSKLGVTSRLAAVRRAAEYGLI
jgi:DNA-binding CsgD family transcriptional regulator